MAYYKLIDAIDTPVNLNVVTRENGVTAYKRMRLNPGKKYAIPDDKTLFQSITEATTRIRYSEAFIKALDDCHARYEVKMCPSCGGRVKKIEYHLVEVVE